MDITIACAALSGRIYAGKLNKSRTAFLDGKQDVTSDVLKAVIDKVGFGQPHVVTANGIPEYEITVKKIRS